VNFDSYTDRVVGVAAALVNALTPGRHGGRPVELDPELRTARCMAVLGRPVEDREAVELERLAERLRPVFLAAETGATDEVAELVNALLADYRSTPRLSRHDGQPWHLHFTGSAAGTEWGAGCATGLAVVVDSQATGRLGVCRAEGCDRVYVDVSRNASRRFCSESCLNRTKVAAFRARVRAEGAAPR
jgi:predicted RNA-binding Zn ribbon-like protein